MTDEAGLSHIFECMQHACEDVEFKKKQAEEKKAMAAAAKSMGKKKLGSSRDTETEADVPR